MTAAERVRRSQLALAAGSIVGAMGWGAAAWISVVAVANIVQLFSNGILLTSQWHNSVPMLAAICIFSAHIWGARFVRSKVRVALWIEEQIPALLYSLVTAIESPASPFTAGMEAAIEHENLAGLTTRTVARSVVPPLAAVAIALSLLYASSGSSLPHAGIFGQPGRSSSGASAPVASRIENLTVDLTPPAYTGRETVRLDDPSSVTALIGSRIVVRGAGSSAGVEAVLGRGTLQARNINDGWTVSLTMPPKPVALTLHDRRFERIIVLDPRADNPPKIVMTSPARDTTMRVARLVIHLDATATDDIGLASGYFEYLVTTGSGEIFNARTLTTPAVRFNGSRSGSISGTLDLATLKLNQGDVVSVRAIAQDVNTMSGPGIATSDTRTFRIARADEYDSVAVDAAAPSAVDTTAMSQRMLITMTEKLVKDKNTLTHAELVKRSREIGDLEDRIRRRVHDILFETETATASGRAPGEPLASIEEQEPPDEITGLKQPDLAEAYQALWSAVRALQIAEPAPALPPMRVALKALDRARLANRLYLRGTPPKVIVDIARVRMTGKEKGSASTRTPRTRADSSRAELSRRFRDAVEMLQRSPSEAIRDLTLLRVDALSASPAFAAALSDAVDAFHKGKDATLPLLRARRALDGKPASQPGLSSWSHSW